MSTASRQAQTAGIEYDELAIEVGVGPSEEAEIRVLGSQPGGGARELFEPPFEMEEIHQRLAEMDELLMKGDRKSALAREKLAQSIGRDLYDALFRGKIGETFRRKLDGLREARARRNAGLRIRLSFGEMERYQADIVALPWELLCSPANTFPVSSPRTPLVRYLDLGHPGDPIRIKPPIRVLAILASPAHPRLRPINLEPHEDALRAACEEEGMELEVAWRTPLSKLRETLKRFRSQGKPIHVLHFLGHGGFDATGTGGLNFERPDGGRERVSGRDLARLLEGCDIQVAVLASCAGARMMLGEDQHPFMGAASALLAEIPAVVGMQFSVSEAAAKKFTRGFYPHLAAGCSLEEAVTEGRLAILGSDANNFEWASPVLFLRAPDGKVVEMETSEITMVFDDLPEDPPRPEHSRQQNIGRIQSGGSTKVATGDINDTGRDRYSAQRDLIIGDNPRK